MFPDNGPQITGAGENKTAGNRDYCTAFDLFPCHGHLGCFYFLAIVDNATLNMEVQMSAQVLAFISPGHMPRSGIAQRNFLKRQKQGRPGGSVG